MVAVSVSARLRPPAKHETQPAAEINTSGKLAVDGRVYDGFLKSVVTGSDQAGAFASIAAPLLEQFQHGYSCTLLAYGQTGSGKTYSIFGPTGSLTEASLAMPLDRDAVPPDWGLFPRIALALLRLGNGVILHASAVEIYSDHAFDLLADRAPLSVGSKKAGRNVGGGPTCSTTSGGGPATSGAAGANLDFHGIHPPSCRCGKCFLAKKAELATRLAKRDAMLQWKNGPPPRHTTGGSGGSGDGGSGSGGGGGGGAGGAGDTATLGETRVELKTAADIAKLARTVEVTRVSVGAFSSLPVCCVPDLVPSRPISLLDSTPLLDFIRTSELFYFHDCSCALAGLVLAGGPPAQCPVLSLPLSHASLPLGTTRWRRLSEAAALRRPCRLSCGQQMRPSASLKQASQPAYHLYCAPPPHPASCMRASQAQSAS